MAKASETLKDLLNRQATQRFAQLGYSNFMTGEAKRQAWWWLQSRGGAVRRRGGLLSGHGVLWTQMGYAELVPVDVPCAGRGEVTVEVLSSAISPGTERAQYLRLPGTGVSGSFRPGYSVAGRVLATGPDVAGIAPGDLVAARGVPHASIATVPAGSVYRVPPGVRAEDASLLMLAIISGQGVRLARLDPGAPLCILGAGLIGLLAQRLATVAGAGEVTVIATSRRNEGLAREGGASRFFTAAEDDEAIAALGAPVVIEATGDPNAIGTATLAAAESGRVVLLGSSRGTTPSFPVQRVRARRLELIGAHVGTLALEESRGGGDGHRREAELFLAALAAGRLRVDDLVGETIDPREAGSFYRRLAEGSTAIGARFDWTKLPYGGRASSGRLLSVPDLTGRGVDSERRTLPLGGRRGGSRGVDGVDAFAGSEGRLRVGLLGCGDIAVANAAAVAAAPNAVLTACFDPVKGLAEDIGRAHGAEAVVSAEALLERQDVDAVFLSVPHHLHSSLGMLAASAGKHLLVEKPPANNLSEAIELVEAAKRAGVALSFCFPQRYHPAAAAARTLIEAGAIGECGGTFAKLLQDRPPSYWRGGFSSRSVSGWRESRAQAGGGVLIMNLSHYVDLVRHLVGIEVEEVAAYGAAVDREAEVEDTISVTVRFSNGAVGTLVGSTAVRGTLTSELRVWGRNGHIVIEPRAQIYTQAAIDGVRTGRWQSLAPLPENQMRAVYLSRFATAIHRGQPPEVSPADGLAAQAFMEAAYRSSELGSAVRPGELLVRAPT